MAVKATNQVDIVDLTDGYSVMMSSEAVSLVGGTTYANAATVTTTIYAYCGSEQVACSVDTTAVTFSGSDNSGITVAKDANATQPTLTFTVAASKVTGNCEATIPVVITDAGITVAKKFSFTVSKAGTPATRGALWYSGTACTHTSGTAKPATGISGAIVGDMYLNTQTGNTYRCTTAGNSGVAVWSYASDLTGPQGESVTVTGTTYEYAKSTSGTTPPSSGWGSSVVAPTTTEYAWTRTTTTFSDGGTAVTYSVGGKVGTNGTSPTVTSSKTQYQKSTSGTAVPTGTWSDTALAPDVNNYVWTKTTVTYSNGNTAVSYAVGGKVGAKGDKGDKGDAGDDAITLVIESSAGFIFKNTQAVTTLTARVFQGGAELSATQIAALGAVKWYKDGGSEAVGTGTTLSIGAGAVTNHASYTACLES